MPTNTRRRSERVPACLPVRWKRGDRWVEAHTGDISAEGLFIRTDEQIQPGWLMSVEVSLPDGPPIRMFVLPMFVGQTVSGHGIGAQFFLLEQSDRRRWKRHYQQLLKDRGAQAGGAQLRSAS